MEAASVEGGWLEGSLKISKGNDMEVGWVENGSLKGKGLDKVCLSIWIEVVSLCCKCAKYIRPHCLNNKIGQVLLLAFDLLNP